MYEVRFYMGSIIQYKFRPTFNKLNSEQVTNLKFNTTIVSLSQNKTMKIRLNGLAMILNLLLKMMYLAGAHSLASMQRTGGNWQMTRR